MSIQKRKGIFVTLIITMVLMVTLLPAVQAATSLDEGTYTIGLKVYASGTTDESRSASSVKTPANMVVSADGIKVQVALNNTSLTEAKVGGSAATVVSTEGDWTTYEFAISDINATVPVNVKVPAMGNREVTIDLAFQGSTAALVKAAEEEKNTKDETNASNNKNTNTTSNNTEKVASPKTSDDFNGVMVSAVIILSAGVLYVVRKKIKALV